MPFTATLQALECGEAYGRLAESYADLLRRGNFPNLRWLDIKVALGHRCLFAAFPMQCSSSFLDLATVFFTNLRSPVGLDTKGFIFDEGIGADGAATVRRPNFLQGGGRQEGGR